MQSQTDTFTEREKERQQGEAAWRSTCQRNSRPDDDGCSDSGSFLFRPSDYRISSLLWKAFESAQVTKRMFQRKSLWEAYPARVMRGGQRLRNPRSNWKLRNTVRVQKEWVPYIIRLRKTIIERSDKFDEEYAHYDEPITTEARPRDVKPIAKQKKKNKTDEQTPREKGKPNLEGKTPSKPAEACPSEEARTTDAISQPSDV